MASHEIKKWLQELRQEPEYTAEGLVLDFIGACEVRRAELGLSYAELARRMGVSRAYVSKLMRGTQQSSVGSLTKLAAALGCEVRVDLVLPSSLSHLSSGKPESSVARRFSKIAKPVSHP